MIPTLQRPADPTPPRPDRGLPTPPATRSFTVDVETCHLANPVLAVQRLLASDANAFARVTGDEQRFRIELVVPDGASVDQIDAWVRWVVHHAGVRGPIIADGSFADR